MTADDDRIRRDRAYLDGRTAKTVGKTLEKNPHHGRDRMSQVCAEAWADGWIDRKNEPKAK